MHKMIPSTWEIDLIKIIEQIYKTNKWQFPRTPFHSLIDLIEWLLRIPEKVPRNVHLSSELQLKILTPFELAGLNTLREVICSGIDSKPYLGDLTRSIRNRYSKNNDYFSSDWGLLHFHLGVDFENKGLRVSRTKRVLIAKVTATDAYFIDIVNHGKGSPNVWGDISHLEILYRNWPYLMEKGVMKSEAESENTLTAKDYIKLRNSGFTIPVVIDGNVIFPEFGISIDGSQQESVMIATSIQNELDFAGNFMRNQHPDINTTLAIYKDGSVGFLDKSTNNFYMAFDSSSRKKIVWLFSRLSSEIKMLKNKKFKDFIAP